MADPSFNDDDRFDDFGRFRDSSGKTADDRAWREFDLKMDRMVDDVRRGGPPERGSPEFWKREREDLDTVFGRF